MKKKKSAAQKQADFNEVLIQVMGTTQSPDYTGIEAALSRLDFGQLFCLCRYLSCSVNEVTQRVTQWAGYKDDRKGPPKQKVR